MVLQLGEDEKTFEGRYVDIMPALLDEGRVPMTISGLMKRRLQVLESGSESLIDAWWGNYFDSGDGIAYWNDEIKIVSNAQPLLEITKDAKLSKGALVLTEEQYDNLKGKTLSRKELRKAGMNDWLLRRKVLEHPVWKALALDILPKYADAQFKKYDYETAMAVYIVDEQNIPTMRAFFLDLGYGWSGLDGGGNLDVARLVGVREK